ncbi:sensor histidine kinase [Antrihabitans cavernicola]|uniref:sensor histidine kinase n=1 Tax=Antrihabitans cavernicola TaxID=2495913 RepID=UPI001659C72B|nr:sensor histidine kinase [Spelaeibacter cavernicola]
MDTHLLRELGALLVGRDSTALLELVKNAYDADASVVTVHAEGLDKPKTGTLTVSDDGNGMTYERFKDAFLRIAGRDKEGNRLSPRFGRRYTGAKGIGRLAAQKLAPQLNITSIPRRDAIRGEKIETSTGVRATLDWDRMESDHDDLSMLGDSLTAQRVSIDDATRSGTTLTLSGISDVWSSGRLGPFIREIRACRPADIFIQGLPRKMVDKHLLFDEPIVREHGESDVGFSLDLSGQFEGGDELWPSLAARSSWVVEIDANEDGIKYCVSPTKRLQASLKPPSTPTWARKYEFAGEHPNGKNGPFFQARILVIENTLGRRTTPLARFAYTESGIRVFLEGFRVLPYGSLGDDWLELDRDYSRKPRDYDTNVDTGPLKPIENEGYFQLGNRSYYGAVLLTERGAPHLQALVNREGFVPDEYFDNLKSIVRTGVDLSVRARASLQRRISAAERADARSGQEFKPEEDPIKPRNEAETPNDGTAEPNEINQAYSDAEFADDIDEDIDFPRSFGKIDDTITEVLSLATNLRAELATTELRDRSTQLLSLLQSVQVDVAELRDEQLTLRTLAGVGTQFTAFVHEINGLLGQAQALRSLLSNFPEAEQIANLRQRKALRALQESSDELVQSLTRQMSYMTDVVGPDARRRRRRLNVTDRVESAIRVLAPRIADKNIRLENAVSVAILTPPVFPAEMSIILTNLLTNAIKFVDAGGTISVDARLGADMSLHLRIENTGVRVAKSDWSRFFRPFESSTTNVDVVLGQGMGLGLPIVRSLASDYEGTASFVTPSPGFSTAVEVVLPDPRPDIARKNQG